MTPELLQRALRQVSDLLNSGQPNLAANELDNLLVQHPDNDQLLHPRMLIHAQAGELENAFAMALRLSDAFKQDWRVSFQIVNIARGLKKVEADDATEQEICRLLEYPGINCGPFSELIFQLFMARARKCQASPDSLETANSSPIINSALRHFWLTSADTEPVVTEWRRELLWQCMDASEGLAGVTRLATSIARQGHRNEYAFFVQSDEAARFEALAAFTTKPATSVNESADTILALLMYESPAALRNRIGIDRLKNAALDPAILDFIDDDISENDKLRRYARNFSGGMVTASSTSDSVARMYQENPYPRWVEPEANTNPENLTYPDFYGLTASPGWHETAALNFDSMLVAGCGTGWHPISHAINFPWIQITAIDLSPGSLAYAQLMAERLEIDNVCFEQADILRLDDGLGQFDVIESVGTLHHLENPEEGLRTLLRHLRPEGVFRLGLYSRLARQSVTRFRAEYRDDNVPVDGAYIRNLRHRFYSDDEFVPFRDVMRFGDFFSISGCRDLLLHPQESQYSIPDLQRILSEHSLEFVTFSPADMMRFEMLDGAGSPYDLGAWDAVERKEPRLFSNMYQFFAQYRG